MSPQLPHQQSGDNSTINNPASNDLSQIFGAERKVRVGMVLDASFPPDARVEREATALVQAGYEVHLLCEKDESLPAEDYYKGIYIHRVIPADVAVRVLSFRMTWPLRGLIKSILRHFFYIDTVWWVLMRRFVNAYGIDILHVHDLRLVPSGAWVAKEKNMPLVADLHENYPALMKMLKGKHDAKRGEHQFKRWETIENKACASADKVITVIEEARDRLIDKGIPASKITVLPNTVDVEKFLQAPIDHEAIRHLKPYFVLSYVGHINNDHRGVHTVLEAMSLIKDEAPDLHFVGAGAVREQYFEKLQGLIHQYGLMDKVTFTGWLDETGFATYIAASDICVCPHLENEHTHTTFPNKIYLYNLFKKPVVTGSCEPMKRYVRDSMGGEHFESGNAKALADLILKMYHNTDYRRSLGEQGHAAVMKEYNWQASTPALLGMYHQLVDEKLTVGAVQV